MQQEHWRAVEELFQSALALPPAERPEYVHSRTSNPEIRREVDALLQASDSSHPLLDFQLASETPAGTRIGQYRLIRVLGSGGMGTVYLAERADRQFEKQVAIKLVNQGLGELIRGGPFEREQQILAHLEHPNIARLLDAGISSLRQPYLVMEFVDGVPLDRWMYDARPQLETRLDIWESIATAVSYAHRNLVVHRDLKPSNILVGPGGVPKLVDFGIAKLLDDSAKYVTMTRAFTPLYASPEQKLGQNVTTASDIYGLGLILYEIVTLRHPFADAGSALTFPKDIRKDLSAVIAVALREEPSKRYPSVDHFVEDVRRYRKGLPVTARPETAVYLIRKFVGRHKWGVTAAAAVSIIVVALTAVAVVQGNRAARQLARANKITQFWSELMGVVPSNAPSTLRSKGASLRVVDLADSVASRLDREALAEPEAEAAIRYIAGSVYNQVGQFEKAHAHSQRALELLRGHRAAGDPELTSAEILEGWVRLQLGNFKEAEELLVAARRHWKNPSAYTIAALESLLGIAQLRLAKRDEAEKTFLRCISVMESGLGQDNPWIGLVLSNLSIVYQERGDFERQREILEKAVRLARARRAESPESLGWAALNLAILYRNLDQPEPALISAQESLTAFGDSVGEASPPAAQTLTQIAWATARLGRPGAEAAARKAVQIEDQKLPASHYERAVGLTWLGFVLLTENKLAEARSKLEEAIELRRKTFPNADWHALPAAGFLGEALVRQGERDRGLELLRACVNALREQFGPENPRTRDAQARLDRNLKTR